MTNHETTTGLIKFTGSTGLEEKNMSHTHFEIITAILMDVLEQSLSNNHSVQVN